MQCGKINNVAVAKTYSALLQDYTT